MSNHKNGDSPEVGERRRVRQLSKDKVKRILTEHLQWITYEGRRGEKADLSYVDLTKHELTITPPGKQAPPDFLRQVEHPGIYLQGADLEGAILAGKDLRNAQFKAIGLEADEKIIEQIRTDRQRGGKKLRRTRLARADLRDAEMWGADLRAAELWEADLRGANLEKAILEGADLNKAKLQDSNLKDADLTDVTGLVTENLGGADLTNALLPEDIKRFWAFDFVKEASRKAGKLFVGMLIGCGYVVLTVANYWSPAQSGADSSQILPILQTKMSVAWFAWAAPALLIGVYTYFHLYLLRIWEGLASLPAYLVSGEPLDRAVHAWLPLGYIRSLFKRLAEKRPPLHRLQMAFVFFLVWFSAPLTLLLLWIWQTHRRVLSGIILSAVSVAICAALGMVSFHHARAALRREEPGRLFLNWQNIWWSLLIFWLAAVLISIGLAYLEARP